MAFTKHYINELFVTVVVLSAVLSTASAVDCHGRSFHCVNSTHFMICVDLGGGVSQAIDNFYIACPPPTVCNGSNYFECEFPAPTTPAPSTLNNVISDTTLPWEEIVTTSSVGNITKEFSENYMNTERAITLPEFSITTDTTVDGSAKTAPDIYINNELNVTEIVPTSAVETTTQIDYIQQSISEDRNKTEILPTTEYVTSAIVENVRQNTSETWNSNPTESVTAGKESTQTTIENLVITETVTEPAPVVTDQITQTTTTLLLETNYLNTELPQVITLTNQNESGTTNYETNIDLAQILDKADVTQSTGISNNISPAETTPLSNIIAETTTGSTEHLATTSADIISTDVYHSSTSAPSSENKNNKSSSANVSVISNLNSADESGLLEKKTTQTITVNDSVGETTTTFDAWMVISGNENPTTVSNSNIFPDVTDTTETSIYLETQTDVMDTKVTDEKIYDVLTNTQNPQDATKLPESLTTEEIQNNPNLEQPTTAKNGINSTKDSAQRDNLDMITTVAGINIPTTFSTIQAMQEAQSPKQTSADRKIDVPIIAKNKENVGSTEQLNPINKLSIDSNKNLVKENITIATSEAVNPDSTSTGPSYDSTTSINVQSIITKDPLLVTKTSNLANTEVDSTIKIETVEMASTKQPTTINKKSGTKDTSQNIEKGKNIISKEETIIARKTEVAISEHPTKINEDSLTTITIPSVATENNEFYASDAVNEYIITKDSIYGPTTSNNSQSWITTAPLLVTKTPKFSGTKLDGGQLDGRSVANVESNIQSSQVAGLDSKSNKTLNTPTEVINSTRPVTIEVSDLKTNLQNSIDTKQDEMRIAETIQIDAITEKPTKKSEKTFTNTIPNNAKETKDIPTREVVNPDIVPTDATYIPAISNNDQTMITEASALLTTEPHFFDTKIDGALLIEPAGIDITRPSAKANGETKTTDAIKNGATDNTKNQSNRGDLDGKVINAAYAPTVRNSTHNPTDTKQHDTTNTQTVEISAITEQPTETNEETFTMVTAQNVVIEKIGMPTGEAINPDIVPTDAAYTPAISNSDQPMITEASVLLKTEPNFDDTKIDVALLIEPTGIASTGPSTKANGETKTTDAIKNGATDNSKNQSKRGDLDGKVINAAYAPTVRNSTHNPTNTKQDDTTNSQNIEISAITEQPTEKNEETFTMVTAQNVVIEKIGMPTGEAVNPDIVPIDATYIPAISNNDQTMITEASALLTTEPHFFDTKIDGALLIEPAGIDITRPSAKANGETKTTDAIKNGATDNTKNQSNRGDLDGKVINAAYAPTVRNSTHNPTDTKQHDTTNTQTVEISAITEQPTETNEETFTMVTAQNVVIEKIGMPTGEAINPDIVPTDAAYTPAISNSDQPMITEASVLLKTEPNFDDTKIDVALLIEPTGIASTGPSTKANGETKTTDAIKNGATDNSKNQSKRGDLDGKVINAAYAPTVRNSTHNPTNTKQDDTTNSQNIEISAITEQPTEKNEETFTMVTAQNVVIEKIGMPTGEAVNPDIVPTDATYTPAISNSDQPMITEASVLLTTEINFDDTKIDGALLIEPTGIDSTGPSTKANGETKTTDAIKNGATDNTKNQSNRDLDGKVINAAYAPTVRNSTHNPTNTKQDDTTNTQTIEISAITEQPTETNEETFTMVTAQNVVIEKIGMPTGEAINPDIVPTDAAYTPAISNSDQLMITETSVLLTTEPNFDDTKTDRALLIKPAGIASTGPSTKANGETKTTDAIKNGGTDNTKNQSNRADLDSKVMNAAYKPTGRNSTHSPTDTKQDDTTNTQTVEISAITEQPTETNDETLTMVTAQSVVIEKIGMQTGEAVNPDIVPTDAAYTPAISNNDQSMITEASVLLTTEPNFADMKIDGALLIEPAGIAGAGPSTKANGETKTTDTIKNGATDNTKNQSNQADVDSKVINAAYTPTVSNSTHNPTDTKQDNTTNAQTVQISAITDQPTETNEETLTMITTQNVAIEKIGMQTGKAVNPDIISTEPVYEATTDINAKPMMTAAPTLLIKKPYLAETKLDEALLIEPITEQPKMVNEESKKSAQANEPTHFITLPENPTKTEQDGTLITPIINTDAITEPTKKNEDSTTIKITQNIAKKKTIIAASEVDATTPITITDSLPVSGAVSEDNMQTKQLSKQVPTSILRTNEPLYPKAVGNVYHTQESFIIEGEGLNKIPTAVEVGPIANNNTQSGFQEITQSFDETPVGSLPDKTTHPSFDKELASNTVLETAVELTTNTHVLPSTDAIELNLDKEPTTRTVGGTDKSATGVSTITNNDSNTMNPTFTNAQSNNNYQTIISGSNDETKLSEVNSKVNYTNVEKISPRNVDNLETTIGTDTIIKKGVVNKIHDAISKLDVTSEKSISETFAPLQNTIHGISEQNDSSFVLSGSLSTKEETNGIDNQTSETTPKTKHVADSTMQPSTVESNDEADKINKNPLDNYLIDQSNQDTNYQNKYSVTNAKETYSPNNNFDNSKQKDSTILLGESSTPRDETIGIANQNIISQLGEGETILVINNVPYSITPSSTAKSNAQASNIHWNPLNNYLIDQFNQDKKYQTNYSVSKVTEISLQNNNFDHSMQKDGTVALSESSTPNEESNGVVNQNVVSQLGEGETTLVIDNVPYSTTQPSAVKSNDQASNKNWNPLDNYLIDQPNQNSESLSKSNVSYTKLDGNDVIAVSLDPQIISQQPPTTSMTADRPIYVYPNNNEQNSNIATQERNGQLENTTGVKSLPEAENVPVAVTKILGKKNNFNLKTDGLVVTGLNVLSATTVVTTETTVAQSTQDSIQNTPQVKGNLFNPPFGSTVEETGTSVKESGSNTEFSPNINDNIDTSNKESNIALSENIDTKLRQRQTPVIIEDGDVDPSTVKSNNLPSQSGTKLINQYELPTHPNDNSEITRLTMNVNTEFSPNGNENIDQSIIKDTSNIALSKNREAEPHNLTPVITTDGKVDSPTVENNNLLIQSTNPYELPTHSYDFSEMTTSTPNLNHVIDVVDKTSKPILDVLPLPINKIKLSTSVTDKPLLTDSSSGSQTKNTIIITESYKSTTLNPIYVNSRAQPGDNVGKITTAQTIVNPTFNIQTQVKAQPIANTKDSAAHGSDSVDSSQNPVIATTASIIEGANLRPPTGIKDYSLQHPQQTDQGSLVRTDAPNESHIILHTEASITGTNNDNPNNILSPSTSGDVHIGIASQFVSEANNEVTDTPRNNAKTVTLQSNSSKNLTSSSTQKINTPSVTYNPMPNVTNNIHKQVTKDAAMPFSCISGVRGRYSENDDCRKFYICVGNNQPIVGHCPENTVFSDIKKLCTKNLSHCIRDNEFKCPSAGRFSDFVKDNVYYICVNHKNHLYKFKFQCQKGYILNSTTVKCIETREIESNESVSISSDNSSQTDGTSALSSSSRITNSSKSSDDGSKNDVSSKSKKSNETEESPEKSEGKDDDDDDDEVFKCKKEGKFPIRNECRRYYLCKKRRGEYRRKIKKCESGSVFHKNKKKCVDADSYEC